MGIDNFLMAVLRAEMLAIFVLWSKVMFHYGRAAKIEWVSQGGRMGKVFWEIVHPFTWAFRQQLSRWGLMKPHEKSAYETYTPYTPGVILRFAIFAAALGPVLSFFRFFTQPYNTADPEYFGLFLTWIIFAFSIFGALSHLYVAHRVRPNRWMYIGFWFPVWCVVGPPLFYFLWPTDGVGI
jgi:hypothetical protein